jgi:hypothetical protein
MLAEQDALVNIGGVQVRARLEAPLAQGQATLLQVQPESVSGQVVLKPLETSGVQIAERSLPDLLKGFDLKDTAGNRRALLELHQAQAPLTKETVKSYGDIAARMPAGADEAQWREAATLAVKRGLPVTQETVASLHRALFGNPLDKSLQAFGDLLGKALAAMPEGAESGSARALMGQVRLALAELPHLAAPLAGPAQPGSAGSGAPQAGSAGAGGSASGGEAAGAGRGAQAGGAAPGAATVQGGGAAALHQQAAAGDAPGRGDAAAGVRGGTDGPGGSLAAGAGAGSAAQASGAGEPRQAAGRDAGGGWGGTQAGGGAEAGSMPAGEAVSRQGGQPASGAAARDNAAEAAHTGDAARGALAPSAAAEQEPSPWIGRLLKALGVEHEQQLARPHDRSGLPEPLLPSKAPGGDTPPPAAPTGAPPADADPAQATDTLKGLLLSLSASDEAPAAIREGAQQLTQQLTGQQLLLTPDRTGMFSHMTLMLPLMNSQGSQTAAIHIQSRKGSKGELDATNCHLVFDLDMKTLGMTLIDVQVTDRIVGLRVHNDFPAVGELLEEHREEIKAGLEKIGYQFLSLKVGPYPEPVSVPNQSVGQDASGTGEMTAARAAAASLYHTKPYKGVDLRV